MITETIFENRYMHVPELSRMGADIEVARARRGRDGRHVALRRVGDGDRPARERVPGDRGPGRRRTETEVLRVYHLDRGYESIEKKLRPLGARIERVRGDG